MVKTHNKEDFTAIKERITSRIIKWGEEMKQMIDEGDSPHIVAEEYFNAAREFVYRSEIYFKMLCNSKEARITKNPANKPN